MRAKFYLMLIITSLFLCSSCRIFYESTPSDWGWRFQPKPLTGMRNFPSAKTEYGKGFRDGCYSALNAVTKGLTTELDPRFDFRRMKKSSDYGLGWFEGLEQCTYIMDWEII